MTIITHDAALFGTAGCGCHQQILAPGTLPDGTEPLVFLDFKNGVYQSDGSPSTLEALVGETEYGEWEPSHIVPGTGLVEGAGSNSPSFIGDALDLLLSGSTVLIQFVYPGGGVNSVIQVEMITWPGFETYYWNFLDGLGTGGIGDQVDEVLVPEIASGPHKCALTLIDGKISQSIDGAAILTINPAAAWTVAPNLVAMAVSQSTVESVGFYPPQDDAELPALSAL